ncbi:unnamed protein product [Prorocentrum cordatum]|uniref:Anoctamin transmembrane domain-containing protein n=1 Tax=Prorocentrum cordatum TaxID=2364126 RepID=A0ABN9PFW6_9DINO|nr:unnamed protein product [Polarella glacialis]
MIGFYFLWLRHTLVSLVLLVPVVSVLFVAIQSFDDFNYRFERAGAPIEEKRGLAVVFLSSAFCLSLWGQFYVKGWKRLESYYRELWGVELAEFSDVRRPDYRGDYKPSPINEHVMTKAYSPWKRRAVFLIAFVVTLVFIGMVIGTVMLVYYSDFHEDLTATGVSILFSVQIFAYQLVWDSLSDKLVELQNPRTDMEARNMDVAVLFPFSFVSAYANLAVKAVYEDSPWGQSCLSEDCTKKMELLLYQVVLPVFFAQAVSMLKPYVILRFSLWWEARRLLKQGRKIHRGFIEVQAKRPPFGPSQLNSEMNIMAVLLGYVLLFGSVAPGIVVAVTLIFLVKIRIDAFKLCNVYQRVIPARLPPDGIGQWGKVVQALAEVGRMTCLFIPIFNLSYFNSPGVDEGQDWLLDALGAAPHGLSDLQKVVLWFACKEVLDRLGQLVDFLIPDVSTETKLMRAKRQKVAKRMRNQLATRKGWNGADEEEQPALNCCMVSKSCAFETMSPRAGQIYRDVDTKTTKHLKDLDLWDKADKSDFGLPFDRVTYFG